MEKEVKPGLWKIRDGIYLKERSMFGEPSIIYPIKDPDTGKISKKNLLVGGWARFFAIMLMLLFVIGAVVAYNHDMGEGKKCVDKFNNDPCFRSCAAGCVGFNFTLENETGFFDKD